MTVSSRPLTGDEIRAQLGDGVWAGLSERDRSILARGDDKHVSTSWDDLVDIVATGDLNRLSRLPSELARYIQCKADYTKRYGGVMQFILKERLGWALDEATGTFLPTSRDFLGSRDDIKLLYNDFPYAMAPGIVHVVVWSKVKIPTVDDEGHISSATQSLIHDFVNNTFSKPLELVSGESVLWFKNYTSLQSVREIGHFHVLLNNPNQAVLDTIVKEF